ncbi:MAG: Gfo/Idh/MocA family oxidoreductase [Clostridia bacterium]|nr:Gfo/Idh/MocA family oxidoreductase [Clostridia bacterium]
MLKYAILGFGGLGKLHFGNYNAIKERKDVKLVAVCDIEKSAFEGSAATNLGEGEKGFDFTDMNLYTDAEEMFEKEDLDFIVSALPTYIHEKYAVMAMEKGIHVFSEKPMALSQEEGAHMIEVSKKTGKKLMVGQVVRYFPAYVKLKEIIESGEYGKIIDAEFRRFSAPPRWGWKNWFFDEKLSGGAVLDLHVHDVDFINYLFGKPEAVCTLATHDITKYDSVTTLYYYDNVAVTSRGSWGEGGSYPFSAPFRARFEKATVEFKDYVLTVYPTDGEAFKPEVSGADGYTEEVIDFIDCIENDRESTINPPEASLQSIQIALAERESADKKEIIKL